MTWIGACAGATGGETFLFVKDANAGSASVTVNNFTVGDTLAVHGYVAFTIQAAASGAILSFSDGSQVTFSNSSVGITQQVIRVV